MSARGRCVRKIPLGIRSGSISQAMPIRSQGLGWTALLEALNLIGCGPAHIENVYLPVRAPADVDLPKAQGRRGAGAQAAASWPAVQPACHRRDRVSRQCDAPALAADAPYRKVQKLERSSSKGETRRQIKQAKVCEAHRLYLEEAERIVDRAREARQRLTKPVLFRGVLSELDEFMQHAARQIDQVRRRVMEGQIIPHEEKVFSLFHPHTEWISKGKAGVPAELGLRVCVVEDQQGFILHHQIMEKVTDDTIAVSIVREAKQRCERLRSVSLDKGFHSKENQAKLAEEVKVVVMPKKGRVSAVDKAREDAPEFVRLG
jgi:hypothetical protein